MNNQKINIRTIKLAFMILLAGAYLACTKADDYKKFTETGEISYTGKLDSVKVMSGNNRVYIRGLFLADPKVTQCKIFWNNKADSVVIPVKKKYPIDTLKYFVENVKEGVQNFEIYTYDGVGNKSIPVYKTGRSYGQRYQSSLFNRPIESAFTDASGLTKITWQGMDRLTGVFATEVEYTNLSNVIKKIRAKIDETTTSISDIKPGTTLRYRTLFLPDTVSIDTFSTAFQTQRVGADITSTYFKNKGNPFLAAASGGRWRNIADWTVTANIKNHGGLGGWCSDQGGCLAMEMGWDGTAQITNGKIYQTFTLPAGSYSFEITMAKNEAKDPVYIVAAAGNTLPDVADVSTSLGYTNFANNKFQFTLTQSTTVSIGFLATMLTASGNQFWIVKEVMLKSL
ncbi:DUF5013 domain-containing protein [Pedobacter sp. ISL-68]|uniref:DUF4998 domain-containing protein n=1 Tax=unclassified Pedobacter TaxID=2628915 RepID=UPI001BE7F9AC|nr:MULTISPECIES: DUF4998 domain-containing protein [unclassified Pedobacter]MBT2561789.1 DUF5013 domain-containing protein [Pedobacter sp. ISL-64]MBT2591177.1 DUF5013 domain-containing protein [Pedobacter sp. ISL-68]